MNITEILASKFNGNKTYITAAITIITAITTYFSGGLNVVQAGQLVVTALLGAFLRHGISSEVASAINTIATDLSKK